MVIDIICLILGRNLFDSNKFLLVPKIFCLNQIKILFHSNKTFLYSKQSVSKKSFLIQSNIFSKCNFITLYEDNFFSKLKKIFLLITLHMYTYATAQTFIS